MASRRGGAMTAMAAVNEIGDGLMAASDRGGDLFSSREARAYNAAERQFSRFVEGRLQKLLQGDLNRLALLRRYHQEPDRLAAPLPKHGLDPGALRLPVVEELLLRVLVFLQTGMPGGPVAQEALDGRL